MSASASRALVAGPVAPSSRPVVGPPPVVGTATTPLDPPLLATPTVVERIADRIPHLPRLPAPPRLVEEPAFPLVIVVALALFVAITGRGDRRDPKLTKAELDARAREIGFS